MKRISIRNSLFLTYALIILVFFLAAASIFFIIELPKQKEQTFASLGQNAANIAASMDQELDKLHTFALNTAYSTLMRDRFSDYLSRGDDAYLQQQQDMKILLDIMAALIVPTRTVEQLNLYTTDGTVICSGLYSGQMEGTAEDQPWYAAVDESEYHHALLFTGEEPHLAKFYTGEYGKNFVTYAMRIYDNFYNVQGYLELQQNLSSVLSAAIAYQSVYGESVYVFDGSGTVIFPLGAEAPEGLFDAARAGASQLAEGSMHLFSAPSNRSDFLTVLAIDQGAVLEPVYDYAGSIAIVLCCVLLLALGLAYFAARRITTPISQICRAVSAMDITQPPADPSLHTKVEELQTLSDQFSDMQHKLYESLQKQLLLQDQEMQSRMLALQSQMNPHFLFNSLAAIQSMADEGMTGEIQVMCQSMSNILRYISSSASDRVPLADELRYTKDYLICMVIRYQGDLGYEIDVPDSMLSLSVPKLCVQLLVENAIKFSATKRPPYRVSIIGRADEHQYTLTIQDNGPGFSEEALAMLREKIAEIDRTGLLPSLEINGMGLLNIYIRYRLHGQHSIFRLENRPEGGASITIGEVYHGTEV